MQATRFLKNPLCQTRTTQFLTFSVGAWKVDSGHFWCDDLFLFLFESVRFGPLVKGANSK
jgi:hypothetical protein